MEILIKIKDVILLIYIEKELRVNFRGYGKLWVIILYVIFNYFVKLMLN